LLLDLHQLLLGELRHPRLRRVERRLTGLLLVLGRELLGLLVSMSVGQSLVSGMLHRLGVGLSVHHLLVQMLLLLGRHGRPGARRTARLEL